MVLFLCIQSLELSWGTPPPGGIFAHQIGVLSTIEGGGGVQQIRKQILYTPHSRKPYSSTRKREIFLRLKKLIKKTKITIMKNEEELYRSHMNF
jgi:hypothetical protein